MKDSNVSPFYIVLDKQITTHNISWICLQELALDNFVKIEILTASSEFLF